MALTEVYCLVNRARGMEVTLAFTLVPVHVNPTSELLCIFALPFRSFCLQKIWSMRARCSSP